MQIVFDYMREPLLGGALLAVWLVTGLSAGAYAALVLSMFRPGAVLKGIVFLPGGSGRLRQALVIFQFGTLIALIVSTLTIQHQTEYAMRIACACRRIRFRDGRRLSAGIQGLRGHIPGVLAASCSSGSALTYDRFSVMFESRDGGTGRLRGAAVDYGFFELFGVKPMAGRLFSPIGARTICLRQPTDKARRIRRSSSTRPRRAPWVIRIPGPRSASIGSGAGSSGSPWSIMKSSQPQSSQLIGVVPDFSVGSVRDVIEPTVYFIAPDAGRLPC